MNSSSNLPRILKGVILGLVAGAIGGCYLLQSAHGQLLLMAKRRPIAQVLREQGTSPNLRAELEEVNSIRDFATRELKLPDNGSYRTYADVGRPYVVWNVVVAPEFSVEPQEWCYPIVGCVSYRGYFSEASARAFADSWRRRGNDVNVGGVAAYSTLGHFDDPILNTMVAWNDVELAGIVFHELTHQLLYVSGDASFNEALATTVEEEGVRRWLLSQGRALDLARHVTEQGHYLEVIGLLRNTRSELKGIYASGADPALMRERKRRAFAALRASYERISAPWPVAPFKAWFGSGLNNAELASVATYYDCVPGFERELEAAGGDLERFYRRAAALSKLDQTARDAAVCPKP